MFAWVALLMAAATVPRAATDDDRAAAPVAAPVTATVYPTLAAALQVVLAAEPRVLGVGEYHQTVATAGIPSALKRFTREVLPVLREADATDLVVETWITTGSCGEVEKQAVAEVEQTTERPAQTENEVLTLLRRAKDMGLKSRILQVTCGDYRRLMSAETEVDFEALLRLARDQILTQLRAALRRRASRLVLSYGGALHNDLYPRTGYEPFAFGPAVAHAVAGKYVELDLVVPELVERNADARTQPWYRAYRHAERPGRLTLVRQGDGSFVLVFPPDEAVALIDTTARIFSEPRDLPRMRPCV